jgi:non-lysosomal glucosylceramidase
VATGDEEFLHDNWEVVKELMHYLSLFDRDRDGMIENEGFPDQVRESGRATAETSLRDRE